MKSLRRALVVVCLLPVPVAAQARIDIAGTVYCRPAKNYPEVPIGNVVVEARSDRDVGSAISQLNDGYYRVPLRYRFVVDRNVQLRYFASGTNVMEQTAFVSREKILTLERIPVFVVTSVELIADCSNIKPIPVGSAPRAALETTPLVVGGISTLAGLVTVIVVAAEGETPPDVIERLPIETVSPGRGGGGLLSDARTVHFTALGFRYAAARDPGIAIITNPASSAFEEGWHITASSRLPPFRTFRVAGTYTHENGLAAGIGYYRQKNTEKREIRYDGGKSLIDDFDSHDQALIAFVAKRIWSRISGSIGLQLGFQNIEHPDSVRREKSATSTSTTDRVQTRDETNTNADVSIGLSFQAFPSVRLGLAASNVLGSRELLQGRSTTDRVIGGGISWFRGRLHLGTDVEKSGIRDVNASFGASFVVRNDVEVGAGYLTTEKSVRLRGKLKGVDYSARWSGVSGWTHYLGSSLKL